MKFKALAYIGLAWLSEVGTFETRQEAMDALGDELDRQSTNWTAADDFETQDHFRESFWANSQVDEVQS